MGSYLDDILGASKDPTTISSVKNPTWGRLNDALLGLYDKTKSAGDTGLDTYIKNYLAGKPAAEARTGREVANIESYLDGGKAREAETLRTATYNDALAANDLASRFLLANTNRDRVMGSGGGSSYLNRQLLANLAPIQAQAALTRDAQARSDWENLGRIGLSLTGAGNAAEDASNARALLPYQAGQRVLAGDTEAVGGLMANDLRNTFYGLKSHPGPFEGFNSDYGMAMDAS